MGFHGLLHDSFTFYTPYTTLNIDLHLAHLFQTSAESPVILADFFVVVTVPTSNPNDEHLHSKPFQLFNRSSHHLTLYNICGINIRHMRRAYHTGTQNISTDKPAIFPQI
jgi:hypothetical protein